MQIESLCVAMRPMRFNLLSAKEAVKLQEPESLKRRSSVQASYTVLVPSVTKRLRAESFAIHFSAPLAGL